MTTLKGEQVTATADELAQCMLDTWRREADDRRISTPGPVKVRWRWGPDKMAPPPEEWERLTAHPEPDTSPPPPDPNPSKTTADSPEVLLEAGVVTRLHDEVYCRLPAGWLVLIGMTGVGKTGAMILLLLTALEHRRRMPDAERGLVPVPVWLTLGGWNPSTESLHEWATTAIYRDHPYLRAADHGPDAAGDLLRTGRVVLFLDGLDEMAPTAQGQALARVKREAPDLRIVLSSRPEDYARILAGRRAHNTAIITLQPVDPETASTYLQHDQIGSHSDRWAQLGDYLTQHPDSIAAQTLNTPLTLSLVRATYQDQDLTPLIDPTRFSTVAALREHLIDRILMAAYPDEDQRVHATRWLAWVAHHMGSDHDLAWWHIPTWVPRWQLRLVFGLVFGLTIGLTIGLGIGLTGNLAIGLTIGLTIGLGIGATLVAGPGGEFGNGLRAGKVRLFPRWLHPHELRQLLAVGLRGGLLGGLAAGLLFVLIFGLIGWLAGDPLGGIVVGLIVGFIVGFIGWLMEGVEELCALWTVPLHHAATATPTSVYRMDRRANAAQGLAFGLALGLVGGPMAGLAIGLNDGLTPGLVVGFGTALLGVLTCGLPVGLAFGLAPEIVLTEIVLAITGVGRVKFMRLLENAHRCQVLHQAGAVYQFRHAELQKHLVKLHRQDT